MQNNDPEPVNILLMYGPAKDEDGLVAGLRDAIIKQARDHKAPPVRIYVIMTETVKLGEVEMAYRPATPQGSYQAHFRRKIKECHGAIAIIGADEPNTTTARGNVWFERGFYIAIHSDHHLVTTFVGKPSPAGEPPDWVPKRFGDVGIDYSVLTEEDLLPGKAAEAAKSLLEKVLQLIGVGAYAGDQSWA